MKNNVEGRTGISPINVSHSTSLIELPKANGGNYIVAAALQESAKSLVTGYNPEITRVNPV